VENIQRVLTMETKQDMVSIKKTSCLSRKRMGMPTMTTEHLTAIKCILAIMSMMSMARKQINNSHCCGFLTFHQGERS